MNLYTVALTERQIGRLIHTLSMEASRSEDVALQHLNDGRRSNAEGWSRRADVFWDLAVAFANAKGHGQ